ncbi:MAG: DUF58 domain-containing protein [Deltaproteobacteria bacterium]|nr:DUF58 domain-containing protein [Deltaproteobacteria bacterium]
MKHAGTAALDRSRLFRPELAAQVRRIEVRTRRRVGAWACGRYESVFKGTGLEFEEVREYTPGDDVGAIDWKVSARSGRPYVKLYREEREIPIWLLLDLSASSRFGSGASKLETMAEFAALIGLAASHHGDRVGAVGFRDRIEGHVPPGRSPGHVWRILWQLLGCAPRGTGTRLTTGLQFVDAVSRRRGIVFVVSDFLDEGYERALGRLARRHDVVCVPVFDPADGHLPSAGLLCITDFETGEVRLVDARARAVRGQYRDGRESERQRALSLFQRAGAATLPLSTVSEPGAALERFFREREHRGYR